MFLLAGKVLKVINKYSSDNRMLVFLIILKIPAQNIIYT